MHATTKMNAQNNRVVITADWDTGQKEMGGYGDVAVVLIVHYCGDRSVSMSMWTYDGFKQKVSLETKWSFFLQP